MPERAGRVGGGAARAGNGAMEGAPSIPEDGLHRRWHHDRAAFDLAAPVRIGGGDGGDRVCPDLTASRAVPPPGGRHPRAAAPGPRLALRPRRRTTQARPLLGAALLHAAVVGILLVVVQVIVPTPPAETTITLLWQPQVPLVAGRPAPPPAQPTPVPPSEPAAEPPPPPPQVAAPPPPPQVAAPPPPPAETPPPALPTEAAAAPLPLPPPAPPPAATARRLPLPPPVPPPPPQPRAVAAREPARQAAPPAIQPDAPAFPPAAPPAPDTAAPSAQASSAWLQSLAGWLARHRVYPEAARRRGEEGNVTVRFTVQPSGQVTQVTVLRSSGSALLDAAAEAMLRGASLPPFDAGMVKAPLTASVQIRYALEN